MTAPVAERQVIQLIDGRVFLLSQEIIRHMPAIEFFEKMQSLTTTGRLEPSPITYNGRQQESIRVIGNDAFMVRESIIKEVSLTQFSQAFGTEHQHFDTGLLPRNVIRYVSKPPNIAVVATEVPPSVRPILYAGHQLAAGQEPRRYNISLPYLYMFWKFVRIGNGFRLEHIRCFTSDVEVKHGEEVLYRTPLGNVHGPDSFKQYGTLCTGSMDIGRVWDTLAEPISEYFALWISAQFNDELPYKLPTVNNWPDWERKTAENPDFILEDIKRCARTKNFNQTVQDVLNQTSDRR